MRRSIWTNRERSANVGYFHLQCAVAVNKRETDNSSNSSVEFIQREKLLGDSQWKTAGNRTQVGVSGFNHSIYQSLTKQHTQMCKDIMLYNQLYLFNLNPQINCESYVFNLVLTTRF